MVGLLQILRRHALGMGPESIDEFTCEEGGAWMLLTRGGTLHKAQLLPSTYIHPALVVLNFSTGKNRRSVVILPDRMDAEALRRLRVRLRCER